MQPLTAQMQYHISMGPLISNRRSYSSYSHQILQYPGAYTFVMYMYNATLLLKIYNGNNGHHHMDMELSRQIKCSKCNHDFHKSHNDHDDKHQNNWQAPNDDCHIHKHLANKNHKWKDCVSNPVSDVYKKWHEYFQWCTATLQWGGSKHWHYTRWPVCANHAKLFRQRTSNLCSSPLL